MASLWGLSAGDAKTDCDPGRGALRRSVMSRFAEFLSTEKIDPRRLLAASRQLERLRPEDRAVRLQKRLNKGKEAPPAAADAAPVAPKKSRSGRPVTHRVLELARTGGSLSGPQKTRVLRALNHLLGQKKKDPVDLRKIF
jgi:hypothetical protein